MYFSRIKSSYKSRDGEHTIRYYVWFPSDFVRGVIQLSHGMNEYLMRYEDFAEYLAGHGYVVCGNDHLGHGESINDENDLGYFASKHGWQTLVDDMHTLTKIMKKNYPDLPYYLFGHSMGSFLARAYCTKYGRELDGAVFCGTSNGLPGISAMLTVIGGIKEIQGERYRSKLLSKLAFGSYNSRISNCITPSDWISRDKAIVEKYMADEKCQFIFTVNGFENLIKVLWYVNNEKWFSTFRKDLPVLLIAGDADPVGNYGKGVRKVYENMLTYKCDARIKLYDDARHEIINEINRAEVYEDVLRFFDSLI